MVIGITGGIGSGKSAVVEMIKSSGYVVLSADGISHEIMLPGSPVVERLAGVFGQDILNPEDRSLKRQALADKVFVSAESTEKLNEIVQTAIKDELIRRLNALEAYEPAILVFVEIPLLYEAGWDDLCDKVWCITASEKVRIKRVMQRDGISRRSARIRMERQMPEANKVAKADVVIYNDGTIEELQIKVEKAIALMKQ